MENLKKYILVKKTSLAFLIIQSTAILFCAFLAVYAMIKNRKEEAEFIDDTLGLYQVLLFVVAVYHTIFWFINLFRIRSASRSVVRGLLNLGIIFFIFDTAHICRYGLAVHNHIITSLLIIGFYLRKV